jgi:hypothetical protein
MFDPGFPELLRLPNNAGVFELLELCDPFADPKPRR